MLVLSLVMSLLARSSEPPPEVLSRDGGEVPTVAPRLTPALAPMLAPELVADGGLVIAEQSLSVYSVDLPVEASITGGAVALGAIVDLLIKPTLSGASSCRQPIAGGGCDPADLPPFDRYAVGRSSKEWTLFSDVALYTSIIVPTLYLALESLVLPTAHPWKDFAGDLLVVSESMALTSAFQTILKFTFRRPRPVRYLATAQGSSFDQELSFPSGHTSMVAAATTALTTTVFLRHPESPLRFVVLGLSVALTTLTAVARVEGGHHFPTDVLVGVLIGGFSGFVVPYLHRHPARIVPTASFNPADGSANLGLAGAF